VGKTTTISGVVGHSMRIVETDIDDIKLLKPVRHVDSQGLSSEVFEEGELLKLKHGIDIHFVQENHTWSASKGVVRGLHFESAQAKLSGVTAGSISEVAVDIRRVSSSFGCRVSAVLSAVDWNQIFIPEGFAHGYCTLEPNTEVIYKVSTYYSYKVNTYYSYKVSTYYSYKVSTYHSHEHDRGPLWSDPAFGISWPLSANKALVSDRDRAHPILSRLPRYFRYEPPSNPQG
jgi:dTDP-4-dehydrorhamnose 3,5-epimerase